jgi:cell division protease FtsH
MNLFKTVGIWLVIAVVVFILGVQLVKQPRAVEIPIVQFLELAEKYHDPTKEANLAFEGEVVDRSGKISGKLAATVKELNTTGQPKEFRTSYVAGQSDEVLAAMRQFKVRTYTGREASGLGAQILISLLMPIILIVAIWFIFMRQIQSSGNKAMSFGKSRAKLVQEGQTKVTFDDVAGVDEAKEELREIVDFLKEPKKFTGLGARIPKGVLLYGPPGTGKTLLAKAVAGEANVPFFSISGSDFVEMFVGVGASRVRDLFEQAKKNKPCLVFIDEIDAVGRHRFAGIGGGHDEREQTLNQLLVEMDGFQTNEGVILMAATNRSDVLDPALLRPGRFDRQVAVDYPDIVGREKILKVHSKGVKLGPEIDLKAIARSTPGFSGADLANLINEAALLAARRNRKQIGQAELDEARDRVSMGPERRSLVISDEEKRATAIHEAGHALAAYFTEGADPVRKITIIPRGRSLGVTQIIPDRDPHSRWKKQLKARLVVGLGGMAAELEVFGESGTGVGNDLYHVASIARKMVTAFGMSDRVGPRALTDENSELFVGREMGGGRDRGYSEELARIVDEEVKLLVDEASAAARHIMSTHRDKLDALTQALLERETIMGEEFRMLMEGKPLPPLFNNRDDAGAPPAAPPAEEKKKVPPRLADILDGGPAPQPS